MKQRKMAPNSNIQDRADKLKESNLTAVSVEGGRQNLRLRMTNKLLYGCIF